MNVLAAPDSFKGTCSAPEVAASIAEGAADAGWEAVSCPMSDGGEGFAEVLASASRSRGNERDGTWELSTVTGPLGSPVRARWWWSPPDAVVECATASGLVLAGGAEGNDPVKATSRGTGELVVAAIRAGAKRVLVGLGGSASTDGGRGAVEALTEAGGIGAAEVVAACDVTCPFVEAAKRFGPQKGASAEQIGVLRRRLERYAGEYLEQFGVDVTKLPYAGAAGGLGGGLAALGARLVSGFGVVADEVSLEERARSAQLVVTGEGSLDVSSWSGKVVGGVVEVARRVGVHVLVVAGTIGSGDGSLRNDRVSVESLSERFGAERARSEPGDSVRDLVREYLART
ncbi:MAG: glycerate kinase family protein [Acidimicrobiales bacterium]